METVPPDSILEPEANPSRQRFFAATLLLLALGTSAVTRCARAQGTPEGSPASFSRPVEAVSVEVGGTSGTYSVHYDRRFAGRWAWRVGGGLYARITLAVVTEDENVPSLLVGAPVGVRWLPGGGDWRLEVGLSVAPGAGMEGSITPAVWGGPSAGIRHQPTGGGLFFRATVTATATATPGAVRGGPGIGIELGYSF
jgi:hypothetical protein